MGSPCLTPEIRAEVKALWQAGNSSGVIAKKLGRTRNSIIGLVMRMKLPKRITKTASPLYHRPKAIPRVRKKRPKPLSKPPIFALEIIELGIPMIATRDNQCRYPLWAENGAPDFQVCGTVSVGVYCPQHLELCCTSRMAK